MSASRSPPVGRRVIMVLRAKMFTKLLLLPKDFYDNATSGEIISKFTFDVEQVANASTKAVTILVRDTFTVIGVLAWMFYLSVPLTLVQALGENYDMEMVELHHNQKKDAPSGTALKLAECLAEARGWDLKDVGNYSREGIIGARPKKEIGVQTIRGGDVVGVHTTYFMGPGERIEAEHLPTSISEHVFMGSVNGSAEPDEEQLIRSALSHHRGNRTRAAEELGMHRSTLWRKMKSLGLGD